MPTPLSALMDRLADRRALRRWRRASRGAASLPLRTLQAERLAARALRDELGRWLHVAEGRLAIPLHGASSMPRPLHCDWSLRPEIWSGPVDPPGLAAVGTRTGFGREATVFHDCTTSEITLRQVRNQRESDLAPFGLRMDVFGFDGSYLSLVIDLPDSAVQGLKLRHIVRLDVSVETERPLEIFARLNVRHGPNTEQVVRELPPGQQQATVEFDLAYTRMNEKRVDRAWLDLIFEGPQMNQILIRDLTLSRRPRADV